MDAKPLALTAALALAATLAACGKSGSEGETQQAKGEIKEAVGSITGDDSLKREGQADQVVGGVKETVGDAKDAVKDATN